MIGLLFSEIVSTCNAGSAYTCYRVRSNCSVVCMAVVHNNAGQVAYKQLPVAGNSELPVHNTAYGDGNAPICAHLPDG